MNLTYAGARDSARGGRFVGDCAARWQGKLTDCFVTVLTTL